jgi:hypothetical protein
VTLRTLRIAAASTGSACSMTVYVFLTSLQRIFLGAGALAKRRRRRAVGHVVVEQRREQSALPAIDPFHEPAIGRPPTNSFEES